ncbi:MAG TPA: SRPBCC family protein [Vicinamibacterales bacterium]|nr:SRPBCC family protein [Vicinamibacterales bacterium]
MLRWSLYLFATLAGLVAIVLVIGWSLPVAHTASRTRVVAAPPDRVFVIVSDFARYPDWRTGVTRVTVTGDPGPGLAIQETADYGDVPYRVETWEAPTRLVTRIASADLPFGGTWTYDIHPDAGGGSRVTITEHGEVYNVFFRFMARFVFGHTSTLDQYLTDLDAAVRGSSAAGRSRP